MAFKARRTAVTGHVHGYFYFFARESHFVNGPGNILAARALCADALLFAREKMVYFNGVRVMTRGQWAKNLGDGVEQCGVLGVHGGRRPAASRGHTI